MNKKQYIAPALEIEDMEILEMICGSLTGVGGDASITYGGYEDDIEDAD